MTNENSEGIKTKKFFRKRNIIIIVVSFFVLVTLTAGYVSAQKIKHFRDDGPLGVLIEKIVGDLNLSDQQKAQVESIKSEIKAKMEANRNKHEDGMKDFDALFRSDNLTKESLKQVMSKHEADREEMKEFMLDELVKFHDLLTPDQRNKAADKLKEMKDKRDEMHKNFQKDRAPENH